MTDSVDIAIHVDPACPWAWLTSRWLAEVEKVRPERVTTRLFFLAEANREQEPDDRHLKIHTASETALRVLVAARRSGRLRGSHPGAGRRRSMLRPMRGHSDHRRGRRRPLGPCRLAAHRRALLRAEAGAHRMARRRALPAGGRRRPMSPRRRERRRSAAGTAGR